MTVNQRLHAKTLSILEKLQRRSFIEEIMKISPLPAHALSVSCGNGIWDYLAFQTGRIKQITATDIIDCPVVPDDIDQIRALGPWEFVKVKADQPLPFADESFDFVFSQDVIEHTAKPYLFLSEQFRVLRKGGTLLVGTPNLFRPANLVRMALGRLQFPRVIGQDSVIGDYIHVQEFHERHLQIMMEEVGFREISFRPLFFGIPTNIPFASEPTKGISRACCHFFQCVGKKSERRGCSHKLK